MEILLTSYRFLVSRQGRTIHRGSQSLQGERDAFEVASAYSMSLQVELLENYHISGIEVAESRPVDPTGEEGGRTTV